MRNDRLKVVAAFAWFLWTAPVAWGQAGAGSPPTGAYRAVRAGHLFDARAGRLLDNQVVLIHGDRIVEVGPAWSEGRLTAASKIGRRRRAAANPRGMQGYAAGR